MKKISNFDIVKNILIDDLLKARMFKFIVIPIIVSTIVYSIIEIGISDQMQALNKALEKRLNEKSVLLNYILQMLLVSFLTEANGFVFTGVVQLLYRNMSKSTFRNFMSLSPAEFNKIGSGEIQVIINRKSESTKEIIEVFILNLLPIILKLTLALKSVVKCIGAFAGYIMGICIFVYCAVTIGIAIWRANIRRELNKAENKSSNKLQDSLINHETVAAFRTVEYEVQNYNEYLKVNEKISNKLWRAFYFLNFVQQIVFISQSYLVIIAGLMGYLVHNMTTSQLIFLFSITVTISSTLRNLGYIYTRYTQAIINARSIHDTMVELKPEDKGQELYKFTDSIKFTNINFKYENKLVFDNLNFEIRKGEKIAIIGSNGCGKSTLMKLLLKFENFNGSICIDGVDIRQMSESTFRNIVGYVPQNTFLFNDTVKYNIKYGTTAISDEEIFSLCKKFGLFEVFSNLEKGFETSVGERGRLLSGGEKQKILLMRAMLRKQEILILDEPTAALDKESENSLINLILEDRDQTVIMIIHNLELLYKFDKIFFISNRKIKSVKPDTIRNEEFSRSLTDLLKLQT